MSQPALPEITAALHFATHKHRRQRRKDPQSTPYINHPIELLNILVREVQVEDSVVLMGALLHDTVEDTATTLAEIRDQFGPEVARVVEELTDDKSLPEAVRKQQQVEHAATMSDRAKLVKLADKIANVRDIAIAPPADWPTAQRREYCFWCKRVVDTIRNTHIPLETLFDRAYATALQQNSLD
ncbi:MAG: HD domain-containing protein [Leptolyngbyaceae cyanobacterium]